MVGLTFSSYFFNLTKLTLRKLSVNIREMENSISTVDICQSQNVGKISFVIATSH